MRTQREEGGPPHAGEGTPFQFWEVKLEEANVPPISPSFSPSKSGMETEGRGYRNIHLSLGEPESTGVSDHLTRHILNHYEHLRNLRQHWVASSRMRKKWGDISLTALCTRTQKAVGSSWAPDSGMKALRGQRYSRGPEETSQNLGTFQWRQWQGPPSSAGGAGTMTKDQPALSGDQGRMPSDQGSQATPPPSRRAGEPGHLSPTIKMHLVTISGKKEEEESLIGRQNSEKLSNYPKEAVKARGNRDVCNQLHQWRQVLQRKK